MPFYAYRRLHAARESVVHLPHYREKTDRLLFRLVNYLQPSGILEIGTGGGLEAKYMAEAKDVPLRTWSEGPQDSAVARLLGTCPRIVYDCGSLNQVLREVADSGVCPDLVHIAHTPYYKKAFEELLPLAGRNTCFIIGFPYADREKREWWRQVIADPRTGVTFDLYDIGLVFFDKKRVKEHRVVNFL